MGQRSREYVNTGTGASVGGDHDKGGWTIMHAAIATPHDLASPQTNLEGLGNTAFRPTRLEFGGVQEQRSQAEGLQTRKSKMACRAHTTEMGGQRPLPTRTKGG